MSSDDENARAETLEVGPRPPRRRRTGLALVAVAILAAAAIFYAVRATDGPRTRPVAAGHLTAATARSTAAATLAHLDVNPALVSGSASYGRDGLIWIALDLPVSGGALASHISVTVEPAAARNGDEQVCVTYGIAPCAGRDLPHGGRLLESDASGQPAVAAVYDDQVVSAYSGAPEGAPVAGTADLADLEAIVTDPLVGLRTTEQMVRRGQELTGLQGGLGPIDPSPADQTTSLLRLVPATPAAFALSLAAALPERATRVVNTFATRTGGRLTATLLFDVDGHDHQLSAEAGTGESVSRVQRTCSLSTGRPCQDERLGFRTTLVAPPGPPDASVGQVWLVQPDGVVHLAVQPAGGLTERDLQDIVTHPLVGTQSIQELVDLGKAIQHSE